jgi:Major Facilitator Superfamily
MLGRFLTSYKWGVISDRIGRKPVLLLGITSVLVFSVAFGLSTSLWFAIVSRFLLGLGNGIVGVSKTCISEICGREHEVRGMGIMLGCWSISFIIGPALGGVLADPCQQYPGIFKGGGLFQQFPYLLPNLFSAAVCSIALAVVHCYVPETLTAATSSFQPVATDDCDDDSYDTTSVLQAAAPQQFFARDKHSSSSHATQCSIEMVETAAVLSADSTADNSAEQSPTAAATAAEEQGHAVLLSARRTRRRPAAAKRSNLMQMLSVPLARNCLIMYMVLSLLVSDSVCTHSIDITCTVQSTLHCILRSHTQAACSSSPHCSSGHSLSCEYSSVHNISDDRPFQYCAEYT